MGKKQTNNQEPVVQISLTISLRHKLVKQISAKVKDQSDQRTGSNGCRTERKYAKILVR